MFTKHFELHRVCVCVCESIKSYFQALLHMSNFFVITHFQYLLQLITFN